MISGSKAENYDVPAQEWFNGLVPSPDMVQNIQRIFALHQPKRSVDIKVERQLHDMRILVRVLCASGTRFAPTVVNTKYGTIRKASFDYNLRRLLL